MASFNSLIIIDIPRQSKFWLFVIWRELCECLAKINRQGVKTVTAEQIVMSAYQAFGSGDMDALEKIFHPNCQVTFHAEHPLGGTYHGFSAWKDVLNRLDQAWPGLEIIIDKTVSNETDVVVFCICKADGNLEGKAAHHFVVKDEKQFTFDFYWDGEYWAKHCKI